MVGELGFGPKFIIMVFLLLVVLIVNGTCAGI